MNPFLKSLLGPALLSASFSTMGCGGFEQVQSLSASSVSAASTGTTAGASTGTTSSPSTVTGVSAGTSGATGVSAGTATGTGAGSTTSTTTTTTGPTTSASANSSLIFNQYQGLVPIANCMAGAANIQSRILYYKSVYSKGQSKQISLRAHVMYPANYNAGQTYPVVALFHGGGWWSGSSMDEMSQAFYWASRGMIAITFEYRLYNLYGQSPTSMEDAVADARSAFRWMRKYSSQLSIDSNRIVGSGDSAGGHLVLASAMVVTVSDESGSDASISSVPNAIFAFYPVVDLSLFYTTATGLADPRSKETTLNTMSPIALAAEGKTLPPTVIWDGTAETMWLTPYGSDYNFCTIENSINPNGLCSFSWVNGADHGFLGVPSTYQSTISVMDTWLINMGYLAGNPLTTAATMANSATICNQMNFSLISQWEILYGYPQ